MGKPVALEARAEDRETRGFISTTTMSPLSGLMANWMLLPPVSTPTARMTAMARIAHPLVFLVGQRLAGATVIESPVWTPMGSKFSMEQMMTTLSARSRITSSSNSFQPMTDCSMSISEIVRGVQAALAEGLKFLHVVGDSRPGAAEREAARMMQRQAGDLHHLAGLSML